MMLPWRGRVCGTTTWKRTLSSTAAIAFTRSSRLPPPIVSLATTRIRLDTLGLSLVLGHRRARRLLRPGLRRRLEDPVDRARHAVLVRAADDGRHRVEVEERRRRGALPLQRERPPRVGRRAR